MPYTGYKTNEQKERTNEKKNWQEVCVYRMKCLCVNSVMLTHPTNRHSVSRYLDRHYKVGAIFMLFYIYFAFFFNMNFKQHQPANNHCNNDMPVHQHHHHRHHRHTKEKEHTKNCIMNDNVNNNKKKTIELVPLDVVDLFIQYFVHVVCVVVVVLLLFYCCSPFCVCVCVCALYELLLLHLLTAGLLLFYADFVLLSFFFV